MCVSRSALPTTQRRLPRSLLPTLIKTEIDARLGCAWVNLTDEGGERCEQDTGARRAGERVYGHPQEEVREWGGGAVERNAIASW